MMPSPPSSTPEQAIDPVEAVRKHVRRADGLRGLLANAAVKEATGSARLYSTLCAVIADLAVRLEQAERIIAKLPRTRDGVPWVDGDLVYCPFGHPCPTAPDSMPHCDECKHAGMENLDIGKSYLVEKCFHSRAAALSASTRTEQP